ncbi:hypothetical protein OG689_30195 [Kitasatospora sp. NBC_00240]|uniref:hypothetical protein n=1 Tax=Kitasatospora sp. NBC_00240 TaxID=2903567 RepID=UPI0022552506|nr:hypothetical protein [Kitasatospora sp. NBC_00240]MCX5213489.1 hypothetical protein [Kitasatospora sp. NBC_00240]
MPAMPSTSAALYICSGDGPASRDLYTAWCERRVHSDGWTVAAVVTDPDISTPLDRRSGWREITGLIGDRRIGGVVTSSRLMLTDTPRAWARLTALLADRGVALGTINQPLPRPAGSGPAVGVGR